VDFVQRVAVDVIAQLFKLAPLPHLPLRVNAERAAIQKERGDTLAFRQ